MWKLKADERLIRWRDFRHSLSTMSFEKALLAVEDFWLSTPFTPYYLDANDPESWPNPWQMIEENYYCDLARALGMLYTIFFSEHRKEAELLIYKDEETGYVYNLVCFDKGKYVINLMRGTIVNRMYINKNLTLLYRYTDRDLKLQDY